jgi:hypothetical protein
MPNRIIGRWLGTAGALAVAATVVGCAEPAPPPPTATVPPGATYAPPPTVYAPPPGGYSGTSTPPAAYAPPPGGYSGSSTPPAAAGSRSFVASRLTPLRQGPREGFDIIAVLPPGTRVAPDGYVGGDWWQVHSRYGTGWVYSRDLSAS